MSFHTGTSISDLFISVLDPFHHLYANSVWIRPRWLMHKACVKTPTSNNRGPTPLSFSMDFDRLENLIWRHKVQAQSVWTVVLHVLTWLALPMFSGCPLVCCMSLFQSVNPQTKEETAVCLPSIMKNRRSFLRIGPSWVNSCPIKWIDTTSGQDGKAATIRQSTNCSPFVLFEWTWMTPVCKLGTLYMAHKALHMQRCSNRIANLNSPTLQWWQSLLFISSHGCLSGMCGIHVAWAPVAKQIYLVT